MILSLYIVVMILANANLVYGISDSHEDRVNEAELFRAASLKSLTTTFITSIRTARIMSAPPPI